LFGDDKHIYHLTDEVVFLFQVRKTLLKKEGDWWRGKQLVTRGPG